MQKRHTDRVSYFSEQDYTTRKYVIPFISNFLSITASTTVLEIGCGEAGNLKPFLDLGCKCVGIDLNENRINAGRELFSQHPNFKNLELIAENIYNISGDNFKFDLIIMRDVIEHIPRQAQFMEHLKAFIKPGGRVFFGFPPWQNPFGGHQQIAKSRVSLLPWVHLLPTKLYKKILAFSEGSVAGRGYDTEFDTVKALLEIKETGISIERFTRILKQSGYIVEKETFYFINPNYEIKFNLMPRKLFYPLGLIPYLRNFYITAVYCVVKSSE